jgi:hypothetical protein
LLLRRLLPLCVAQGLLLLLLPDPELLLQASPIPNMLRLRDG